MNTNENQGKEIIFEACVGSISQAIQAEKNGAHRIELCFDLKNGGLTPPNEWIIKSKKKLKIPVFVIIRPSFRDFIYTNEEFELMKNQILFCKNHNIDGVVFGILNESFQIDIDRNRELVDLAKPMKITFHMAFDLIGEDEVSTEEEKLSKKLNAIDQLYELKFDRILTKGCSKNALEGKENLRKINEYAKNKIMILPGGGITKENKYILSEYIQCNELHGTKIVGDLTLNSTGVQNLENYDLKN